MKKVMFLLFGLVFSFQAFGQEQLTLSQAIEEAGKYFSGRLPKSGKIAVTNFEAKSYDSQAANVSVYLIETMEEFFVNNSSLTLVDRKNVNMARDELHFDESGEVSDASAQNIGKFLGAQVVVFGSLKPFGNTTRFQARALKVETAEILGAYSKNIKDSDIAGLLGTPAQETVYTETYTYTDTYTEPNEEPPKQGNRPRRLSIDFGIFVPWNDEGVGIGSGIGVHISPFFPFTIGARWVYTGVSCDEYSYDQYNGAFFDAGLIFTLASTWNFRTRLFADGFLALGSFSHGGTISENATTGFDVGLKIEWQSGGYDYVYWGFDLKYMCLLLAGERRVNAIGAMMSVSWL